MRIPVEHVESLQLNTAPEEELARDLGLGPERARRLVEGRPFYSWDDVKRIEGLTDAIVDQMSQSGVELGDPARADVKRIADDRKEREQLTHTAGSDIDQGVPSEGKRSPNTRVS
jgi:type II secretory pathway component PulK